MSTRDVMRRTALKAHVDRLSPNLLRAYVLDMLEDASPQDVDRFAVVLHAENNMPPKVK